jgi:hypothetical protein
MSFEALAKEDFPALVIVRQRGCRSNLPHVKPAEARKWVPGNGKRRRVTLRSEATKSLPVAIQPALP